MSRCTIGEKVTKPNVDDRIAAKLVRDLYGLEAYGIKVENKVSKVCLKVIKMSIFLNSLNTFPAISIISS